MATVDLLDSPRGRQWSSKGRRALVEKDGHSSAITKPGEEGGSRQGESRGVQRWCDLTFLGTWCAGWLHVSETFYHLSSEIIETMMKDPDEQAKKLIVYLN